MENNKLLTADFRDGYIFFRGERYPAGNYAVRLLNQYYNRDIAYRINEYTEDFFAIAQTLNVGFYKSGSFGFARKTVPKVIDILTKIDPIDKLHLKDEEERLVALFSEENSDKVFRHFQEKSKITALGKIDTLFQFPYKICDQNMFEDDSSLLKEIIYTLTFYRNLVVDLAFAFEGLRRFTKRFHEISHFDEEHLLPMALEIFGSAPITTKLEYIGLKIHENSKAQHTMRRFSFDNYRGFILTDFFEGLHHGHYPKQCEICQKYFLMTSARKQRYCDGISPYMYNGKRISCRKYAAIFKQKEKPAVDPIIGIYKRRCACIRAELSKGKITASFAAQAKQLAAKLKLKALEQDGYTVAQYQKDMEKDSLYAQVKERMQ